MKIKTILGILGLSVCSHLGAQSAKESQAPKADSLIVINERDLIEGIKLIVASTQQGQKSSDAMQLLRYQLLINALRGSHQPQVQMYMPQREHCSSCHTQAPASTGVTVITTEAKADPRIAELERQIMELRNQPKQVQSDPRLGEIDRKIDELMALRKDLSALQSNLAMPVVAPTQPERVVVQTERVVDTVTLEPIGFKRQVFFAQGSAKLTSAARKTLAEVIDMMSKDHSLVLRLSGFASPEGNAERNQRLSDERSRAVQNHLVLSGISAQRLESHAAGVDNKQELETVARRVDIELARRVKAK